MSEKPPNPDPTPPPGEENEQTPVDRLPLSQQPGFVPLPSDPSIPLTKEQLDSVFGGEHRLDALRDLIAMLRQGKRDSDDE